MQLSGERSCDAHVVLCVCARTRRVSSSVYSKLTPRAGLSMICSKWDHLATASAWDHADAQVICRELREGITHIQATAITAQDLAITRAEYQLAPYGKGFACEGSEAALSDCPFLGSGAVSACTSSDDVGVCCDLGLVSCGGHVAPSCYECTRRENGSTYGQGYCNGNCRWDLNHGMCVELNPNLQPVDWVLDTGGATPASCDDVCSTSGFSICEQAHLDSLDIVHNEASVRAAFTRAGKVCEEILVPGGGTWGGLYLNDSKTECYGGVPSAFGGTGIASCSQVCLEHVLSGNSAHVRPH